MSDSEALRLAIADAIRLLRAGQADHARELLETISETPTNDEAPDKGAYAVLTPELQSLMISEAPAAS